jgi:hypothetical protein
MKTLSVTAGRSKVGHWLKRAIAGDDIGIVVDGVVVGLRPVEVIPEDYALREYGVAEDEAKGGWRPHRQGAHPGPETWTSQTVYWRTE